MKKHGLPPIESQWCPVCEVTRLPCPANKGRWIIIEMRMLFMRPGQRQIICYKCRQKWYDPAVVKRSLTHMLLDPTWKTAYRRAQETVKAKEALKVIAEMIVERVIEDIEKERAT